MIANYQSISCMNGAPFRLFLDNKQQRSPKCFCTASAMTRTGASYGDTEMAVICTTALLGYLAKLKWPAWISGEDWILQMPRVRAIGSEEAVGRCSPHRITKKA
jgi:hypothetical protein